MKYMTGSLILKEKRVLNIHISGSYLFNVELLQSLKEGFVIYLTL